VVVNPTNLSVILDEVRTYMKSGPAGGVVFFEGFDEIISGNEMNRVIRFLRMLRSACREDHFSSVVPLAYRAVTQRVRNQLKDGFETVVVER